jgi:uncharacterized membrane protein YgcG
VYETITTPVLFPVLQQLLLDNEEPLQCVVVKSVLGEVKQPHVAFDIEHLSISRLRVSSTVCPLYLPVGIVSSGSQSGGSQSGGSQSGGSQSARGGSQAARGGSQSAFGGAQSARGGFIVAAVARSP